MIRATQKELMESLEKQGFAFTEIDFVTEGNYLPSDADWNYKDVPHLNLVHELVDANLGLVGDDVIATINMQKILGVRFPLTVFNYQSTKETQTYFASFFVFQLIIETSYQQIGPLRTRVTTRYAIGSTRFWQIFAPLLKWVLKRNFDNLMTGDFPMRERRGQLRTWGYTFKGDGRPYSFQNTMKIAEANLLAPPNVPQLSAEIRIPISELKSKGKIFLGREDHLGLRIDFDIETNMVHVFPRTCPHEGAGLDRQSCKTGTISCPWHGRVFKPIAQFKLNDGQILETGSYIFKIDRSDLILKSKEHLGQRVEGECTEASQ